MLHGSRSISEGKLSIVCNTVVSVSLDPRRIVDNFTDISNERATTLTQIARKVNIHKCVRTKCRKKKDTCGQLYPRCPSLKTLIARPPPVDSPGKAIEIITKAKSIRDKVKEAIRNTEDLESKSLMNLLVDALGQVEQTVHEDTLRRFTVSGVQFTEDAWLRELIFTSPFEEDEELLHAIYTYCLMWDTDYRLVLKREVTEVFVVQYEPHVLEATQASHSMEIVTRTPEVLYEYITKLAESVNEEAEKMKTILYDECRA